MEKSFANELALLLQLVGDIVKVSYTILSLVYYKIPPEKKIYITYG